ncbi:hypothetical protein K503DRAFT_863390 [Rhizopogon vinicolor AM-OR11-026]|uniref:Uncharacterized protein n=1 Tax=Rhizopogon vinicolor AM-OR11-026 TaxID=1314800 RepID=A0A1B7NB44_9AGAM|nr:hypothetical protein K503DRAFT_863390 [Rhizopogon vinicolor AM-OR11-026]
MSQDDITIDWSKLTGLILSGVSHAVTVANNWSISHPYLSAGALLCISSNPKILLTPLRLTGKTTLYICLLPLRVVIWPFKVLGRFILYILGFRRRGVDRDSFASYYQSNHYGGYVPRDSAFAHFQSYGATSDDEVESIPELAVSWLSGIGAVFVLGRMWGWWN